VHLYGDTIFNGAKRNKAREVEFKDLMKNVYTIHLEYMNRE